MADRPKKSNELARVFRDGQQFRSGIACVRISNAIFELSIGDLFVALDRRRAQDVVAALTYALLATVPVDDPPVRPARKPRPRKRPAN